MIYGAEWLCQRKEYCFLFAKLTEVTISEYFYSPCLSGLLGLVESVGIFPLQLLSENDADTCSTFPIFAGWTALLSLRADHVWMKWSVKVIIVSTGAKLLPMLLLPSQFSVKPNHFIKCLGIRFMHLRLEMEIRNIFLLGAVPSGHVFDIHPGGRRCQLEWSCCSLCAV